MIKASLTSLCAVLLLLHVPSATAQVPATESAINEAIRRQADTIVLRQRLIEGQRAVAEGVVERPLRFRDHRPTGGA